MNDVSKGLVTLIRSAITDEKYPLPEAFSLQAAYPLIKRHQIANIVYEGAVNCGLDRTQPVMQELFRSAYQCLLHSTKQMAAIEKLCIIFNEKRIDYMPLKGCNLKKLYPKPELRIMGDADILIRMEQYEEQIVPILERLDYRRIKESYHELVWDNGALHLELHKSVVAEYRAVAAGYYGNGWDFAHKQQGTRYAMRPEDELVYLFAHFTTHYREGGIGCRQLVDIWVYQRSYPELDEAYLREQLEKLGLLAFYDNICHTIDVWFADKPADEMSDYISKVIFSNGSWGSQEQKAVAKVAKNTEPDQVQMRQREILWWSIFPKLTKMQHQYPVLREAPVLLPFMWVARWFSLLFKSRKRVFRWFKSHKAVSIDDVSAFQDSLTYVGLSHKY